MDERSSKQTQSHIRQCLIYIACFDSGTRTPLDSKLSCIASSGEMASPHPMWIQSERGPVSMNGQIRSDTHVRVECSRPFHHFPELLAILAVLSKNYLDLEA